MAPRNRRVARLGKIQVVGVLLAVNAEVTRRWVATPCGHREHQPLSKRGSPTEPPKERRGQRAESRARIDNRVDGFGLRASVMSDEDALAEDAHD